MKVYNKLVIFLFLLIKTIHCNYVTNLGFTCRNFNTSTTSLALYKCMNMCQINGCKSFVFNKNILKCTLFIMDATQVIKWFMDAIELNFVFGFYFKIS